MKLKVYTSDGGSSEEREFDQFPALEGDKGRMALRQYIIAIQANLRQGNASTKIRSEVRGSSAKPFRQKGTGRARQGNKRSPLMRGGGVVFGPRPRDYRQKINRRIRNLAFRRALMECADEGRIDVIQEWNVPEAKTRLFNAVVEKIVPEGKVLIVDDRFSDSVALASRNIGRVHVGQADSLNAYDLVRFDHVVISEKGLATILARANGGES